MLIVTILHFQSGCTTRSSHNFGHFSEDIQLVGKEMQTSGLQTSPPFDKSRK